MAKRTASAKKQARASVRRTQRNRAVRSEVKTKIVKARRTLTEAPVAESEKYALTLDAVRALDRAAAKGVLHRNNAARRKARLTRQLVKLGGMPELRVGVTTDNGNLILDVRGLTIMKPLELETAIDIIPGVVTNGIFARRPADILLLATAEGVKTYKRPK